MYRCIVVDDEHLARKRISRLFEKHGRNFSVIQEFDNAKDLLEYLKGHEVDIIFLDIEMPELSGIDALKRIPQDIFVIFTTAFKEYALDAFENDAFDYLLKPISQDRFDKALFKIESKWNKASRREDIKVDYDTKKVDLIPVQINDRTVFIKADDISYCSSKNKYVEIMTVEGKAYLLSNSLTELESKFGHLIRIHKGVLVNRNRIKEVIRFFNSRVKVYMNDKSNSCLTSGRSYIDNIKKISSL